MGLEFLIPIFLDAGNVTFFFSTLPQLITTFRNRKNPETLKGLSSLMLLGFIIATTFFIIVGFISHAPLTVILGLINEIVFGLQIYWKHKSKN